MNTQEEEKLELLGREQIFEKPERIYEKYVYKNLFENRKFKGVEFYVHGTKHDYPINCKEDKFGVLYDFREHLIDVRMEIASNPLYNFIMSIEYNKTTNKLIFTI